MPAEFQDHLAVAINAATKAGEILLHHFRAGVSAAEKSDEGKKQGPVSYTHLTLPTKA